MLTHLQDRRELDKARIQTRMRHAQGCSNFMVGGRKLTRCHLTKFAGGGEEERIEEEGRGRGDGGERDVLRTGRSQT